MTETLFNAYLPLIIWSSLGFLLSRFIPNEIPRFIGRSLFWVGIPLEVLALARRTTFDGHPELAVLMNGFVLILGLFLAWLAWWGLKTWASPLLETVSSQESSMLGEIIPEKSLKGSIFLGTLLANTNFVGLAITPYLVPETTFSLAICYSVSNNLLGTYGLGVLISSYFSSCHPKVNGWKQLRNVLAVPSLWAFGMGYTTRFLAFPRWLEFGLQNSLNIVIPAALLLIGIRLGKIQGSKSWTLALIPTSLKVIIIPAIVALGSTLLGLDKNVILVLVLMSGMPTALGSLILAEEYGIEQSILAGSVLISTVLLLLTLPVWLWLF